MRLIVLMLALSAASAGAAEIYRSVAPDGTLVYSDRPTSPDAEPIVLLTRADPPSPAAPPPAPAASPAAPPAAQEPPPRPEPTAEERRQNCVAARDRAERYSTAHRLYRELPSGEREYLNSAEIDEARARAAADVATWCN